MSGAGSNRDSLGLSNLMVMVVVALLYRFASRYYTLVEAYTAHPVSLIHFGAIYLPQLKIKMAVKFLRKKQRYCKIK